MLTFGLKLKMEEEHYAQLHPETRKFLGDLRESDLKELSEAMALAKTVKAVAKGVRWLFVVVISTFIAAASLGTSFGNAVKWWFHKEGS